MVYLIQFRFHGYAKWYAKNLIYDVARKFNVKGVTQKRAVPHISLFGPFQTNDERRLVSEIISVGKRYDLVPFRIKGFDFFNNQNKVIYFDILPFEELISLRKEINHKLLKFTETTEIDKKSEFTFHATIAFKDIDYNFNRIWYYIQQKQEPYIHQHLLRITIIKNSRILYEYDLMQKRLLNRQLALSKSCWDKTIELLRQKTSDFNQDIDVIEERDSIWNKIKKFLRFNFY
ncbi:MAG: 2'-5' RNA ligase family protein [Candidatus Methanoperedens sp.]|nr:2'-5' RNA ligase family protein [Candidatus Methanoperedens sp.]